MAESENEKISRSLSAMDIKLRDKERTILDQAERENCLRKEYEEFKKKDIRKDKEIGELMIENERLYKDLTSTKHRLHEFGRANDVDV